MSSAFQKNQVFSNSKPSNSPFGVESDAANFRENRAACIYVKAACCWRKMGAIEFYSTSSHQYCTKVPFSGQEALALLSNFITENLGVLKCDLEEPKKPSREYIEKLFGNEFGGNVERAILAFDTMRNPHQHIWVMNNLSPGNLAIIQKPPLFIIEQKSNGTRPPTIYGIFFNLVLLNKLKLVDVLLQNVRQKLTDSGHIVGSQHSPVIHDPLSIERKTHKASRQKKEQAKLNRVYNEKPKPSAFVTQREFKRATFPRVAPDTMMIEKPKCISNSMPSIPIASPSPVSPTTPLAGSSQGEPTQNLDLPAWLNGAPQSVVDSYLEAKKNGQVL